MKKTHKIILICIAVVLLFIVGLSFQRLILETGKVDELATPNSNPPVPYNVEKTKQMHEIVKTRPPLSDSDKAVRETLAQMQNPIQMTDDYLVEYLYAPDEFLVEIKTTNIERVKAETEAWFISQGVSQEGICNLPVVFFLNYEVAQTLRGSNIEFNPLPSSC